MKKRLIRYGLLLSLGFSLLTGCSAQEEQIETNHSKETQPIETVFYTESLGHIAASKITVSYKYNHVDKSIYKFNVSYGPNGGSVSSDVLVATKINSLKEAKKYLKLDQ